MSALELITYYEGLCLTAYPDPGTGGAPWTTGYGHTGPDVHPGMAITLEQAEALLAEDYAKAERAVSKLVSVPLTDNERGALTSFVFNVGQAAFAGSTMLRLLNDGNKAGAAEQFERWTHANGKVLPGLVARRTAEKELFLRPGQGSNLQLPA